MSQLKSAQSIGVLVVVAACALAIGAGRATAAAPDLYVNYDATCHFTMSLDSGASVPAGSSLPYGTYQVVVNTPFSFSNGQASCSAVNFALSGPGVSYTTTLGDGDGSQAVASAAFAANSSYTASDSAVTPGTSITFSTTNAAVGAGAAGSSSSGSSGSSSGGQSALGTPLAGSGKKVAFQGALAGGVSAAGKLTLSFKGKSVATLKPGDYSVTVTDKSAKSGFFIGQSGHRTTTITSAAFKGKHSVTLDLTTGQWFFSAKPGGAKTYFVVLT